MIDYTKNAEENNMITIISLWKTTDDTDCISPRITLPAYQSLSIK